MSSPTGTRLRPRGRSGLGAAATLVLAFGVAGCGAGGGTPDASGTTSPSPSSSPSSSPSASTSTAIPTPKVVDGSITATDKSFALNVPSGWTSPKRGVPSPFVVALQDQTAPTDQVLISSFASPTDADDAAQRTASGLAAQKVACDPGAVGGRKLIDCHYAYQGKQVRKMLFSFVHDKTSTLVLYQTLAKSRAAGYAKVEPILASWRWADGSGLAKG